MGSKQDPLTAAEWKIMKIVWKLEQCAAREVHEVAAREHGWAPTTTKTLLRRLVEKGCLHTKAVGNSFLYEPSKTVSRSLLSAADTLMEQFLEGTTGLVLSHMVKKSKLTPQELADLRSLLDQHPAAKEKP